MTAPLTWKMTIWYISIFFIDQRKIAKIWGDKVFSLFLNFHILKKKLPTSFIQMLEVKQKRVPKFFNSITDTPEVLKLWFWEEKWLLRIFTAFFLRKVDLLSNYWAKLLKKVQKHHFFGCVGVAFFFGVSFSRKKTVIFFRFSLASKKWFPFYDWTTQSWVIKFLSVGVYGMY